MLTLGHINGYGTGYRVQPEAYLQTGNVGVSFDLIDEKVQELPHVGQIGSEQVGGELRPPLKIGHNIDHTAMYAHPGLQAVDV